MASFRKIKLEISRTSSCGRYAISAMYRGKKITTVTSESSIFDWLNDNSNTKNHNDAKKTAYYCIVRAYNGLHN